MRWPFKKEEVKEEVEFKEHQIHIALSKLHRGWQVGSLYGPSHQQIGRFKIQRWADSCMVNYCIFVGEILIFSHHNFSFDEAKKLESILLEEIQKALEEQEKENKRALEAKKMLQDHMLASFEIKE